MLQLWLHRAFGPDTDIGKISTNPWSLIQWSLILDPWSSDPVILDTVFPENCLLSKIMTHLFIMTQSIGTFSPTSHETSPTMVLLPHQHVIFVSIPEEFPFPVMTPYNLCTWEDASCMDCLCVNSSLHANSGYFTGYKNTLTSSLKNWKPPRKKSLMARLWLCW